MLLCIAWVKKKNQIIITMVEVDKSTLCVKFYCYRRRISVFTFNTHMTTLDCEIKLCISW